MPRLHEQKNKLNPFDINFTWFLTPLSSCSVQQRKSRNVSLLCDPTFAQPKQIQSVHSGASIRRNEKALQGS